MGSANRVVFSFMGGACVVLTVQDCTLVFDPADHLSDDDIVKLRGTVITLFTHHLDDHFHERTVMKLVEMKSSLIVGTGEVCRAVASFVPSIKLMELKPRRGFRVGELKIYALEGKHEVPTNLYYVTWGPSVLFAGDTGYVPLQKLKANLAFLPAGGSSFSTPESASMMATEVGAQLVVPVHCSLEEAKRLAELLAGKTTVVILRPREVYEATL